MASPPSDTTPASEALSKRLDDIINDNPTAASALRFFWSRVRPVVDDLESSLDQLLAAATSPASLGLVNNFEPSYSIGPGPPSPDLSNSSDPLPWSLSPTAGQEVPKTLPITPNSPRIFRNGYARKLARLRDARDLSRWTRYRPMYLISNLTPAFYRSVINKKRDETNERGCWLRKKPTKDVRGDCINWTAKLLPGGKLKKRQTSEIHPVITLLISTSGGGERRPGGTITTGDRPLVLECSGVMVTFSAVL